MFNHEIKEQMQIFGVTLALKLVKFPCKIKPVKLPS